MGGQPSALSALRVCLVRDLCNTCHVCIATTKFASAGGCSRRTLARSASIECEVMMLQRRASPSLTISEHPEYMPVHGMQHASCAKTKQVLPQCEFDMA